MMIQLSGSNARHRRGNFYLVRSTKHWRIESFRKPNTKDSIIKGLSYIRCLASPDVLVTMKKNMRTASSTKQNRLATRKNFAKPQCYRKTGAREKLHPDPCLPRMKKVGNKFVEARYELHYEAARDRMNGEEMCRLGKHKFRTN